MSVKPTKKKTKPATTETDPRLRDLAGPGGTDVLLFEPRAILVDKNHNPRNFDTPEMRKRLKEIKASIAASGVLTPLSIRFDKAENRAVLLDGETRLRACLELQAEGIDIKLIPCIQV
jgi:ParB-like chromosome segregation protein Spo0J